MSGNDIRGIVADLGIANSATIYECVHKWRMGVFP